jgi:YfiH family protein
LLGLSSPLLASVPGVSHRFFERIGGTSPHPWRTLNTSLDVGDAPARVLENLARVRFQVGVGKDALFTAKQVHGVRILGIDGDTDVDATALEEADGLLTTAPSLAVGVRTADCAPVLLAVDDGSGVAALHAGWRSAVGGIIEQGVHELAQKAGVPTHRIVAAVGPCIGIDAFEVGPEVREAFARRVDLEGIARDGAGDRAHVDLAGACLRMLKKAGVERAEQVGGCTVVNVERFFSVRGEKGVPTGRQLSCIARTDPPALDDEAFR